MRLPLVDSENMNVTSDSKRSTSINNLIPQWTLNIARVQKHKTSCIHTFCYMLAGTIIRQNLKTATPQATAEAWLVQNVHFRHGYHACCKMYIMYGLFHTLQIIDWMVEEMRHWASVNHIKDQLARLEDGPLHAPVICSLQKSEREQENPFDSHLIKSRNEICN